MASFEHTLDELDLAGHGLSTAVLEAVADIDVTGPDGFPVHVSASMGVAVALSNSGWAADQLYARADAALYAAKHAGRG
jgi:predicted signal transduction protein with EAL and GGDEF domain